MFRKTILTIAAAAIVAPIVFSGAAEAGPQFNGPKNFKNNYTPKPYPHPFPKPPKPHKPHWHPHYRPVIVVQPPVVQPVVQTVSRPVRVAAPPKNCLTKEYTPDGLIIFRDVCTNETATTAIPGTPAAAALQQQSGLPANAEDAAAAPQSKLSVSDAHMLNNAVAQGAQGNIPATTDGIVKN